MGLGRFPLLPLPFDKRNCHLGWFAACIHVATPTMINAAPIIVNNGRSTGSFRMNQLVQIENTNDNALQAGTAMEISVCDNVT